MVLALTATPDPANAAVVLSLTGSGTSLGISRTDANGVRDVRLRTDDALVGGSLIVRDNEAALSGACLYTATVSRLVNLLPNPSFENGQTTGWLANQTASSITAVTALGPPPAGTPTAPDGSWVLQASLGNSDFDGVYYQYNGVTAGRRYGFRVALRTVKNTTTPFPMRVRMDFRNSSNVTTTTFQSIVTPSDLGFVVGFIQGVAPAGSVAVRVQVLRSGAGTAGDTNVLMLDAAMLIPMEAAEGNSFDTTFTPDYRTETATATATLGLDGQARIHAVQYPSELVTPEQLIQYGATRDTSSVVHWPIGRDDPIVVEGPARTRQGRLQVYADTYADALAVEDTLRAGYALMLRQTDHPGMDMYFRVTSSSVDPLELLAGDDGGPRWAWTVTVEYVETRNPTLPLLGSVGWTFDSVTATYPTFTAVTAAFATYNALTLGPDFS